MKNQIPIFQSIFGQSWQELPPVMQKHYANRPFSNDMVIAEGEMEVKMSLLAKLASPFLKITKTLIPKEGQNIKVSVRFISSPEDNSFSFDREFRFQNGEVHHFKSTMVPIGANEVIEWTSSGIGWHAAFLYEKGQVLLRHKGFKLKLFGREIPLPLGLIFGESNAEEQALSDDQFKMRMTISHLLFGELYRYSGTFQITEMNLVSKG